MSKLDFKKVSTDAVQALLECLWWELGDRGKAAIARIRAEATAEPDDGCEKFTLAGGPWLEAAQPPLRTRASYVFPTENQAWLCLEKFFGKHENEAENRSDDEHVAAYCAFRVITESTPRAELTGEERAYKRSMRALQTLVVRHSHDCKDLSEQQRDMWRELASDALRAARKEPKP